MLVSFSVKNFMSIADTMTLDMRAVESDNSLLDNVSSVNFNRSSKQPLLLLKSAAIYGPNASGKTNLIVALRRFSHFVCSKANQIDDDDATFSPFLLDPNRKKNPSEFEIKFIAGGTLYRYGLTVDDNQVYNEYLYAADRAQERFIFERNYNYNSKTYSYKAGPTGKGFKEIFGKGNVLKNVTLLSVAHQLGESIASIVLSEISNIRSIGSVFEFDIDEDFIPLMALLLNYFDIGIHSLKKTTTDLKAIKRLLSLNVDSVPEDMREAVSAMQAITKPFAQTMSNKKELSFVYKDTKGEEVDISQKDQSMGTLRIISLAYSLLRRYRKGGVLICDEIETSLHPMLCEAFFHFFHMLPSNKIQLICTTHSTALLNEDVFRRDQVWIMDKDQNGRSQICSISDYKGTRKQSRLGKQYLEGRFGGLPILDPRPLMKFMKELSSSFSKETNNV